MSLFLHRLFIYFKELMKFTSTPKGRDMKIILGLIVLGILIFGDFGANENKLQRVENAKPFTEWPKGCPKEAFEKVAYEKENDGSILGPSHVLPCECFTPNNEIRDWWGRGLPAMGRSEDATYYFRLGNHAVARKMRNRFMPNPICFYDNKKNNNARDFFLVKGEND